MYFRHKDTVSTALQATLSKSGNIIREQNCTFICSSTNTNGYNKNPIEKTKTKNYFRLFPRNVSSSSNPSFTSNCSICSITNKLLSSSQFSRTNTKNYKTAFPISMWFRDVPINSEIPGCSRNCKANTFKLGTSNYLTP